MERKNGPASQGRVGPNSAKARPVGTADKHSSSDLRTELRSQTPLNRRLTQKENAPIAPGAKKRTARAQYKVNINHGGKSSTAKKTKKTEKKKSVFLYKALFSVICYLIITAVSVTAFAIFLPMHATQETNDYTYQLANGDKIISRTYVSWDTVRSGDVYYLDMTDIAEACGLAQTGDSVSIRYIVPSNSETVEFTLNSGLVYINGIEERMDSYCYLRDGKLYVPLSFVSKCFRGMSVAVDDGSNTITVSVSTDSDGKVLPISFAYKQPNTTSVINFADLDKEIREEIILREELDNQTPPNTDN